MGINGVNLERIKEVDAAVRQSPALGKTLFAATSTWKRGTATEVTVGKIVCGGHEMTVPTRKFTVTVDEPDILGGQGPGSAPNPVEVLLSALAGCVTSGIATNADLFGVPIDAMSIEMEADVDARGFLGHDKNVRNGVTDIRYTVTIQSPASEEQVRRCKETIDRKSPVRDTLANPVTITSKLVYKPR